MLGCWDIKEMLECWDDNKGNAGMLECWDAGMLGYKRNAGILEYWDNKDNAGMLG